MALVDLKSKLNQFRGKNAPNNPYQKSGKRDTDLESNVDIKTNPDRKKLSDTVDGEGRQILGQSISTGASTFLKGLKAFGVDIPIENNYENSIKRDSIFTGNPATATLNRAAQGFETIRSSVKNFSNDPLGSINSLANIDQEQKLTEYRSKAYGKFKNYGSQASRVIRTDRDVAKSFEGPIKGGVDSSNVNKTNIIKYGTNENAFKDSEGLIPFRFKDVLNDKFIVFDAMLSGITDTITPEYSSERYIGRPESVYVYQGVQRSVSFTFDVYPMSRQEMPVIWEKLNYLVGLCYPNWIDSPYAGPEETNAITMVSPICELTIGDMYNNTPGYLSGVTMTVQDGTTWEYEENLQLPHYVQVNVEFIYIGKYLPNAKGKHFELDWIRNHNDKLGTYQTVEEHGVMRREDYTWISPGSENRTKGQGILGAGSYFRRAIGLDD